MAQYAHPVLAEKEGYVQRIDSLQIGVSAMKLGAGRETMQDQIDMSAGIVLSKKVGDFVKKGEVLATCYTNKEGVADILKEVHDAFEITSQPVCSLEVIHSYLR